MFFKRIFDFISSLLGLLVLWPVLLMIAIIIKLQMPGSIFFIQERVGQNARLFKMVKFRSMKVNHGLQLGLLFQGLGDGHLHFFGNELGDAVGLGEGHGCRQLVP